MGERSFEVAAAVIQAKVTALFPDAEVVCSAAPEIAGTKRIEIIPDPHELTDVDVGVIRSPSGVAEAGAIWITHAALVVDARGAVPHLIVLLDPGAIVATMHDAYARLDLAASPYGIFVAGPSGTGDSEGVIGHEAQGAGSSTVFLTAW
jgi:L-lactate dehydrogenase complex protein LldG